MKQVLDLHLHSHYSRACSAAKVRKGDFFIKPGYDGIYGQIKISNL